MLRALPYLALFPAHLAAAGGSDRAESDAPWKPVPPCAAPPGIRAPAVSESMCSTELASNDGVIVRAIGLPATETLISSAFFAPQWAVVIGYATSSVIDYFLGDNAPRRNIRSARTTPFTLRQRSFPNGTVYEWTGSMMISTAAYPDPKALPAPVIPDKLEAVGARLIASRQFNTSEFPSEADFFAACAEISPALPAGYAIDATSHWSPTLAMYSGEHPSSGTYENECWYEVIAK